MRVLITGAGGQLGTDLTLRCRDVGDDVVALTHGQLDAGDRDAALQAVLAVHPDVVFNAAAWTAVNDCESDPERAYRDNALAVRWVAEGCRLAGSHLVQISTDYVFDGTKDGPYHEWDRPNPLSVYGASKAAGEQEALASGAACSVVRTSWVMGVHGRNMLKTVLSLRDRDALSFVDDQRGCPSFTADLAVGLRALAAARIPGVFHLTNEGATTWYGFARDVLEAAGADPDVVRPVRTDEFRYVDEPRRTAPRPANSVLDSIAWRASHLPAMPHYRDALRVAVDALVRSGAAEEST